MNSLNSSSVDARVRTAIDKVERKKKAKIGISKVGKVGASRLRVGVALRLIDGRVVVFTSKGTRLLEWEDF